MTIGGVTATSGGRVAVRAVASMRQGKLGTVRFRAEATIAPIRFGPLMWDGRALEIPPCPC